MRSRFQHRQRLIRFRLPCKGRYCYGSPTKASKSESISATAASTCCQCVYQVGSVSLPVPTVKPSSQLFRRLFFPCASLLELYSIFFLPMLIPMQMEPYLRRRRLVLRRVHRQAAEAAIAVRG